MTLSKQQLDEQRTGRTDTEDEYAHGAQAYHSSFVQACKSDDHDADGCAVNLVDVKEATEQAAVAGLPL
jgi:hypothetical protein